VEDPDPGLTKPTRITVDKRPANISKREQTKRRYGAKKARDEFVPIVGSLEAESPLQIVQIDQLNVKEWSGSSHSQASALETIMLCPFSSPCRFHRPAFLPASRSPSYVKFARMPAWA
jgi:hypothetical protein